MKRFAGLLIFCLLLMSMSLTACDKESDSTIYPSVSPTEVAKDEDNDEATITETPNKNVINVFSQTDEVPNMLNKYKELNPDFPYEIKMVTFATVDGDFHVFLDEFLKRGGESIPDIYCVESSRVPKYSKDSDSKYAIPYKELGIDVDNLIIEADIAQYVIDMGTNPEGEIVSLAHRGTGGAFIYRRSIAKNVWGTDDPEVIKDKIGPGWDKFFEAADELRDKGYGIVSGDGDIWHSIFNSAEKPWIVDGKLYIDPKREAFLDYAKLLKDNGYSNNTKDWTEEWYADMEGKGEKEIFGFFGPSWFINYIMMSNYGSNKIGEGTYGDWAVCEPPEGFFWGGTWIYVNKDSRHKEAIAEIIKWLTLDSSESGLQYKWANGLLKIFGNDKFEAVASGTVMNKSVGELDFIGNQNIFDVFGKAAKLANGNVLTQYDDFINSLWREQVREYVEGNKTRDQAIEDFKETVKDRLDIPID
ncbi:MAG: extracellular solute-binding protein [Clostridiales bacterium]|jgi:multiple sugar transport system substrate-binding protein|nr:extracellular solute-binding protein [Clostridiales bacterium]